MQTITSSTPSKPIQCFLHTSAVDLLLSPPSSSAPPLYLGLCNCRLIEPRLERVHLLLRIARPDLMELVGGSIAPTARSLCVGMNQCRSRDSASLSMPRCQSGFWEPIGSARVSDVTSRKLACVWCIHPRRGDKNKPHSLRKLEDDWMSLLSASLLLEKQPVSFVYILCLSEFSRDIDMGTATVGAVQIFYNTL